MCRWNGVNMPISLIKDKLFKTGNYTLIGIVFAISFDYWNVIDLSQIPIPHSIDYLYVYLLLNATAAGPYVHLEKKSRVAIGKFCPSCQTELNISQKFHCSNCGNIKVGE